MGSILILVFLRMLDFVAQIGILMFGTLSLFLVAQNNKWGFVHGLISQVFFITSSVINHQVGVLMLSIMEILLWTYGIYNFFLRRKSTKSS